MAVVSVLTALALGAVLCMTEIPKMLGGRLIRELVTFCVLLLIGLALVILKSVEVDIPNPSDFIAWVFSPVSDLMKSLLK